MKRSTLPCILFPALLLFGCATKAINRQTGPQPASYYSCLDPELPYCPPAAIQDSLPAFRIVAVDTAGDSGMCYRVYASLPVSSFIDSIRVDSVQVTDPDETPAAGKNRAGKHSTVRMLLADFYFAPSLERPFKKLLQTTTRGSGTLSCHLCIGGIQATSLGRLGSIGMYKTYFRGIISPDATPALSRFLKKPQP